MHYNSPLKTIRLNLMYIWKYKAMLCTKKIGEVRKIHRTLRSSFLLPAFIETSTRVRFGAQCSFLSVVKEHHTEDMVNIYICTDGPAHDPHKLSLHPVLKLY